MIRHVVSWKLAEEDAAVRGEQAAEVSRRLNALLGVIPELRAVTAGANIVHPDVNWDVTLVADVDTLDDLEAYQVHPAHQEVGAYIRSVVASRVAVDFEV
ncbi:Stress responsive alpha-beta barrel domain protein Dabb [Microbacterium esteraromaticum]|uniref:Stress responsive alpha-beta barrel domain protein Dabb n=1 Tax=Microbacterium esteraromaticum TaxID=57043 RepID=A0A1R4KDH1_9MICO|nr:Dabb family protein [Microbacterium esteraromaticum]SJN42431.1 Stress responsive alpha-beta barrel domain protein Dabb [Microbacterium esteraromaticum]